jgi:hypothetical protein
MYLQMRQAVCAYVAARARKEVLIGTNGPEKLALSFTVIPVPVVSSCPRTTVASDADSPIAVFLRCSGLKKTRYCCFLVLFDRSGWKTQDQGTAKIGILQMIMLNSSHVSCKLLAGNRDKYSLSRLPCLDILV